MPTRRAVAKIHAIAGALAFLIILSFLTSSLVAELWGDPASIARVKTAIAWSLLALVPALAATGGSGFAMSGKPKGGILLAKFRRMPVIAANGILVLVPAASFLAWKARAGEFDGVFVAVQAVEFAAGSANLVLMGLNMRDGLRTTGRIARPKPGRPRPAAITPAIR